MTSHTHAIGIDIGGTKIAAGWVDLASGSVLQHVHTATRAERGGQAVLDDVVGLVQSLISNRASHVSPVRIGLGICELVDLQGNVMSDFTIAWKDLPVRTILGMIAPCSIESDVRAQALAEARFGAGQDYDPFVFVNIGTGISSCLVQGGVPFAGARGNALVLATGPISVPGAAPFVLEEFASGLAVSKRFGVQTAQQVFDAAALGNTQAIEILQSAGHALGSAMGWLANVLDPAAIVVGGGLGSTAGIYWDALVGSTRAHIWSADTQKLPLVKAKLGSDAGLIGAALSVCRQTA